MKYFTKIFIFVLVITSTFTQDQTESNDNSVVKDELFTEEDGVIVLTDQNFDLAIQKYGKLLIEFYAPWCGHCKELAPIYAEAAKILRSDSTPSYIAKIDATKNPEKAKKYEVEGYPTIKYFTKDGGFDYTYNRDLETILKFMRRKTGPPTRIFTSAADFSEYVASTKEVILTFFGEESKLLNFFIDIASTYDDLEFTECRSEDCLSHYKVQNGNVMAFRKFDKDDVITVNYTSEELKKFIDSNSVKLVSDLNGEIVELVFGYKQYPGIIFICKKGSEDEKNLREIAESIAPDFKGKIQFVITDIVGGDHNESLAEYLKITEDSLPTVRIEDQRTDDLKRYTLQEEITKENIVQFLNDFVAGKIVVKRKSQDVALTAETKGSVLTLVANNFEEYAHDKTKDVLVEFYAPWCGHCKSLQPIYDDLAERLKVTNPNIIIAKIDMTENEIENLEIAGYPTLKLFQRETNKVIDFTDERTLSGLVDFLQNNVPGFNRPEGIESAPPTPEEKPAEVEIKSQDISITKENTSPVLPIVRDNFQEYALDKTKDVLVEFYAPWCGHCQALQPIYEDLAVRLKEHNPNILLAKIDMTENSLDNIEVEGYPTLKLFKRDTNEIVDFKSGDRGLSRLVDFLQANIQDFVRPEGVEHAPPEEVEKVGTPEEEELKNQMMVEMMSLMAEELTDEEADQRMKMIEEKYKRLIPEKKEGEDVIAESTELEPNKLDSEAHKLDNEPEINTEAKKEL